MAPVRSQTAGPGDASGDLRTLARGGTLGLVGVIASAAFQSLLVVAVARGLGAGGSGTFMEAVALFTIATNVAQMGANTGLVRAVSRAQALGQVGDLRTILAVGLSPVVVVSLLASGLLFTLAEPLASLFFHGVHSQTAVTALRIFALTVPVVPATMVALSACRGFGTMVPYVLIQNIALPATRLGLVVAVILVGLDGADVALAWAAPAVVAFAASIVYLVHLRRRAERKASMPTSHQPVRQVAVDFWRFSGPRGLASVLNMTYTWLGVLLVGAYLSTRDAGVYAAAARLSIAGAYALQAVGMAIAPQISGLMARGERARVESVYHVATWWLVALTWPMYLIMGIFASWVMGVFGPEFVRGQMVLVILSVAMLVNLATGNATQVLLMAGRSILNLANAVLAVVINIVASVLLIPPLGIDGAALAWAASIVYMNVAPVIQLRLSLGLRSPFGSGYLIVSFGALVCFGLLGVAARFALGASAGAVALTALIGTPLYLALLYRFRAQLELSQLRLGLRVRRWRQRREPAALSA